MLGTMSACMPKRENTPCKNAEGTTSALALRMVSLTKRPER